MSEWGGDAARLHDHMTTCTLMENKYEFLKISIFCKERQDLTNLKP